MMNPITLPLLRRYAWRLALCGAVGAVLQGAVHSDQFFRSYLFAYLLCLGLGLGCLGLLLLHSIVGGAWGNASRPILQAGVDTMPYLALLFFPVLIGVHHLYPWANAPHMAGHGLSLTHKEMYFKSPFFISRAIFYFAVWSWFGYRQKRTSAGSGIGLVLYFLTVSFASFDWVMSLEPQWSSSIYGAMLMVGDVLSALSFTIVILHWRSRRTGLRFHVPEDTAHDLGNFLLAFVMLWAYMALSQYLIIWSANLPEEIGWYLVRQRGGWQWVAVILVFFQFVLPFFLLLARRRKRHLERLAVVAALILTVRVIDLFWLTAPDFSPGKFSLHLLDLLMLFLVGGAWMAAFCGQLERGEAL